MNLSSSPSRDPDIINSFKALRRAARAARKLSLEMGTPFYVMKDGKIVDLNRARKRPKAARSSTRSKRITPSPQRLVKPSKPARRGTGV
jgi:hypothetical protein